MNKVLPYSRRVQLLNLLKDHGPMSIRGLQACLYPNIQRRKLREVLKRLGDRGLVQKRYDQTFGGSGVFYQIAQSPRARMATAKLINVTPDTVDQRQFRHAQLIHSEACGIWCEIFRRLFPNTVILREHEIKRSELAKNLLLLKGEGDEALPDLLLMTRSKAEQRTIAVAVEIERTGKSKKRLIRKLWKYATQTKLDGVIYICDSQSISERLRHVYKSNVLERALRVKHYGEDFFLFSNGFMPANRCEPVMLNTRLLDISITKWMHFLVSTKTTLRREGNFDVRPPGAGCADVK